MKMIDSLPLSRGGLVLSSIIPLECRRHSVHGSLSSVFNTNRACVVAGPSSVFLPLPMLWGCSRDGVDGLESIAGGNRVVSVIHL